MTGSLRPLMLDDLNPVGVRVGEGIDMRSATERLMLGSFRTSGLGQ